MQYGTSTGTPYEPDQPPYAPEGGISTGGVLTLVVVAAIAVAAKWSGRAQDKASRKPEGKGDLPKVSMDALRSGEAPLTSGLGQALARIPARSQAEESETPAEKKVSAFSAPSVKLQASRLEIPYRLACRLHPDSWKEMCRARKLTGLKRGDLEKTPYGVAVHVEFGGSLDFAAVQRNIDQLETGLDTEAGAVRLRQGRTAGSGILDVRIRDPLAQGVPWEAPAVPVRLAHPLLLAMTPFGDRVELNLKQRVGVFGASGSGKSCVQRLIGAHVAQAIDADLEIWDLKFGVESQHYEGKAHRVTSVDDAVDRLDWLLGTEFPRRAAKLKERGVSEWTETPWDPARVIIIDEGNVVVRGFSDWQPERVEGESVPAKGAPLTDLFRAVEQGRALGVYFVWATQYPKATNLPTEIRSQLSARVCLKLETSEESAVVFKDDVKKGWSPHDLLGPGWLLVKSSVHRVPVDAKAVWLDVDRFRTVRASVPDTGLSSGGAVLPVRTPGLSASKDSPVSPSVLSSVPDRTASTVALDIWTVLLLSEDSPGLSELARRSERSKAAVHAALKKMTEEGTVTFDGSGYRIRVTEGENG